MNVCCSFKNLPCVIQLANILANIQLASMLTNIQLANITSKYPTRKRICNESTGSQQCALISQNLLPWIDLLYLCIKHFVLISCIYAKITVLQTLKCNQIRMCYIHQLLMINMMSNGKMLHVLVKSFCLEWKLKLE